jgi:hypothetical protein
MDWHCSHQEQDHSGRGYPRNSVGTEFRRNFYFRIFELSNSIAATFITDFFLYNSGSDPDLNPHHCMYKIVHVYHIGTVHA